MKLISRRTVLSTLPAALTLPWLTTLKAAESFRTTSLYPEFPAQNPERVREMVGVSHGNIARVRELLKESPALAKATWDWGYGDWETALGAASHTGGREIAGMLIDNGARPNIFTFAMLGATNVVKAYVESSPGIQKIAGPHGLSLMHHARKGGKEAEEVVAFLESVGGADIQTASLPLSEEDQVRYVGVYTLDTAPDVTIEIFLSQAGSLNIRKGAKGVSRTMYHLGNHEFHPAGADAVRIRFGVENGKTTRLSVVDGPITFNALRS